MKKVLFLIIWLLLALYLLPGVTASWEETLCIDGRVQTGSWSAERDSEEVVPEGAQEPQSSEGSKEQGRPGEDNGSSDTSRGEKSGSSPGEV